MDDRYEQGFHADEGPRRRRRALLYAILALLLGGASVAYGIHAFGARSGAPSAGLDVAAVADPTGEPSSQSSPTSSPVSPSPSTMPSKPSKSPSKLPPRYGSMVDTADAAPPKNQPPRPLPKRPQGSPITAAGGHYQDGPHPGWIAGRYVMMYRGDSVILTGQGYIQVRYEIAWFNRGGGMVMPTWTGLRGKLFHVASGGHHRMDDGSTTETGMGIVGKSVVVLPPGAQQMWQNEFFYLDGQVTLHENERGADYNITATPVTWDSVWADITDPATPEGVCCITRYGETRDTGDDGAPVPQYCTRDNPSDPATVPRCHS